MAPKERILKFNVSDDESKYVLVNVKSRGSKPLDVKIQATEGDAEYALSLKHDKASSLKVKNCPTSDAEWLQILECLFKQEPQPDIQATATVSAETSISIVVRKSIQGITQRLGAITIPAIPGGELNVLDWCATAADAAAECKKAASESLQKTEALESEVRSLQDQLEELIKAKSEDETTLLMKFRDLLNEKKVKIREQQKVIASSNTAAAEGDDGGNADSSGPSATVIPERSRKAQQSRSTKRKAANTVVDDSSDDGFEPMEVDKVKSEPEETDRADDTEDTASTASDDEDKPASKEAPRPNTATAEPNKTQLKGKAADPPPKRSLPFAKSKPKTAPATAPADAGSETESDDEL